MNHGQAQRVTRESSTRGSHDPHPTDYKVGPTSSQSDSQRVCRTPPPPDPNTYSSHSSYVKHPYVKHHMRNI